VLNFPPTRGRRAAPRENRKRGIDVATKPVEGATFESEGGEVLTQDELDEYEELDTGLGEKIAWSEMEIPIFTGIYKGKREVEVTAEQSANGEAGTAHPHTFTALADIPRGALAKESKAVASGEAVFAWNSPQLDYALKDLEGRTVRITWKGKSDLGRGRSLNEFRVQVKSVEK